MGTDVRRPKDRDAGDGVPPSMAVVGELSRSLDALAALAAHLRVDDDDLAVDPEVRRLLAEAAERSVGGTDGWPPAQRAAVVAATRAFLRQAIELVEQPDRPPGWADADEGLLQSIGQVSIGIADAVAVATSVHSSLGELLDTPGTTLVDVGTGTGWLAIALARRFPALRVVGIDIFDPALELARRNVDQAGLGDRIEVRHQDATTLDAGTADVVWLPMPFLPRNVVPAVLAAAASALRPGGWVLPGTFPGPGDSLAETLMALRTVRAGGHPWTAAELGGELGRAGFEGGAEVPRQWAAPVRLYAARTPQG